MKINKLAGGQTAVHKRFLTNNKNMLCIQKYGQVI